MIYAAGSPEALAERVLAEEHKLYPAVIADILSGKVRRDAAEAEAA